ncbi:hypothetical protein [Rhodonellum sp.]|uniref:hypothetical protein n=1 Tax=Rhodonellum sp. TaxID=2231180 RepID=UPI00271EE156|nr:hypothetical protein [Rhodonellum sp.]MDO9553265.1 hypothetical protein [Rhodonellum sp.]
MKKAIQNCFLALLCLYRSQTSYTPSRGHRLSDLRAVAYIGRRVPCLLRILHRIAKGMALMAKAMQATRIQSRQFLKAVASDLFSQPSPANASPSIRQWTTFARTSKVPFGRIPSPNPHLEDQQKESAGNSNPKHPDPRDGHQSIKIPFQKHLSASIPQHLN